MKPDPKPRKDNRCALASCRKPRRPVTHAMRKYAGAQIEDDPWCSTNCCREWHGTQTPNQSTIPTRVATPAQYGTDQRRAYRDRHRVPCEDCGLLVEGKGRSRNGGADRPYLCIQCSRGRRAKARAA